MALIADSLALWQLYLFSIRAMHTDLSGIPIIFTAKKNLDLSVIYSITQMVHFIFLQPVQLMQQTHW